MSNHIREIVFDTETTGIGPEEGHKIVEIGAVEVIDNMPTGRTFHKYLDPERDIDADAARVHGITAEKVDGCPKFRDIVDEWLEFIGDSALVAHNASFDMAFLNKEMELIDRPAFTNEVVDTLAIARKAFPGSRHTLDALCSRFEVDTSARTFHGALLDSELLAEVYLELRGGRQRGLELASEEDSEKDKQVTVDINTLQAETIRPPRNFPIPQEELDAHAKFVNEKVGGSLWFVVGDK